MILDRLIVMDDVCGLWKSLLTDWKSLLTFCFKKIWTDMLHVHFSYFISDKTTLANDIVTDKNF